MDGGVNLETGALAAAAGANVLIAGTSIFGKDRQEKSYSSSDGSGHRNGKSKIKSRQQQENANINNINNNNDASSDSSDSDNDKLFIANNIRALERILMDNGRWPPILYIN